MQPIQLKYWWTFFFRGALAAFLGLSALLMTGTSMTFLVKYFGYYLMLEGIFNLIPVFAKEDFVGSLLYMVKGGIFLALGLFAVWYQALLAWILPSLAENMLTIYVIAWGIVTGSIGIIGAFSTPVDVPKSWIIIPSVVVGVLLPLTMVWCRDCEALVLNRIFGVGFCIFGFLLLFYGIQRRPRRITGGLR